MKLDSTGAKLVIVEPGGALSGQRVGVSPAVARAAATAVLEAHPGEAMGQAIPVRLVGLEEIPEGVVVLDADLARRLELAETTRAAWALRTTGFLRQQVEELELEATVERPLEQLVDELSRDSSLSGRLLLARGGATTGDMWIDVAGETFRVRQLRPAPTSGEWLYETGPQTRFSLFAPALRSSVDVVILADCSGSMSWNDITDAADVTPEPPPPAPEPPPPPPKRSLFRSLLGLDTPAEEPPPPFIKPVKTIQRIEALRRALDNLLEVRLRTPGRVSRIALVAFTERCTARFPRGGGMVEMDENAPPELVQQFRDAIALLQPEKAGTNIGNALNHAAELLDKHGRPGNDRLIVLISDGADWKPKSGDDAGELVRGVDEPVSLMEDLNQRMRISLHALGISNEDIFWPWWRRNHGEQGAHPSIVPNHKLLEAMVVVGGGDPTRTGDATVLGDYFSGLGRGVSRRLSLQARPAENPRPTNAERARLRERLATLSRSKAASESQARRDQLCEEIHALFRTANEYGRSLAGQDVFRVSTESIEVLHKLMFEPCRNKREFDWWWRKLHQQFLELRDVRIADPEKPYPVPGIKRWLHGQETAALNHLRNWCSHHWLAPGDEEERRKFARYLERVREILLKLTGRPVLEEDDEAAWVTLQLAMLQQLRDILAASVDVFRTASAAAHAPPPVVPLSGMIYVG
ncbi:MAG TPA: vWA domain-containing protein [Myxococcaceae bacterium]|nr:vWA domain-containing protein [Myxococcaceae bacterium]